MRRRSPRRRRQGARATTGLPHDEARAKSRGASRDRRACHTMARRGRHTARLAPPAGLRRETRRPRHTAHLPRPVGLRRETRRPRRAARLPPPVGLRRETRRPRRAAPPPTVDGHPIRRRARDGTRPCDGRDLAGWGKRLGQVTERAWSVVAGCGPVGRRGGGAELSAVAFWVVRCGSWRSASTRTDVPDRPSPRPARLRLRPRPAPAQPSPARGIVAAASRNHNPKRRTGKQLTEQS